MKKEEKKKKEERRKKKKKKEGKKKRKNIKEIPAPSAVALSRPLTINTNDRTEAIGSHSCNKPCVYCKLLSKTETDL